MFQNKAVYVIYDKNSLDGLFGARICKYLHPDTDIINIPLQYGSDLPITPESMIKHRVYMIDISLSTSIMEKLNRYTDFYWFDNNSSSIEANSNLDIKGVRSTSQATCKLMLYNHPEKNDEFLDYHKQIIELLSDYEAKNDDDIDKWNNIILPFWFGLRVETSYDMYKVVIMMEETYPSIESIIEKGKIIMEYNKQTWRHRMKLAGKITIVTDDQTFIGLGIIGPLGGCKEVFESKRNSKKYDLMVYIMYNIHKKQYMVVLYSDKDNVDCGKIAEYYGGGGNKRSGGFICNKLPFIIYDI